MLAIHALCGACALVAIVCLKVTVVLHTQSPLARWLDRAAVGRRPWWLLTGFCLVVWLPGFFTLPPSDRDESRFAQATRQMLETGDYERIHIGLVERYQKPIGIYWLQLPFAAVARAAGIARQNPIWPYRMPSLLGGMIAVLATFASGRRLVGAPTALLGAALLAGSAILTFEVHMAKTDAALLAATSVIMAVLSQAYLAPEKLRFGPAMVFWAALAAAILIKGPVAPMIVALAVLTLALIGAKSDPPRWLLSLRPAIGAWMLLGIVLPWFVAIGLATHGDFFTQSIGKDLAHKLTSPDQAHGAMFGSHLLLLPLLLFAGGVALVGAAPSIWRARTLPETRFLLAWIVPSWIVFECVATKLPHYTLPLYPAVALLAARWMVEPALIHPPPNTGLLCVLAIAVVTIAGFGAAVLPFIVEPGIQSMDSLGLPALAVAVGLIVMLTRAWPDGRQAVILMLISTPLLFGAVLGFELPLLEPLWIAPRVEEQLRSRWPNGAPPGSFGELGFAEPSLMFVCGTATQLFKDAPSAVAFMAEGPDHVIAVGDRDIANFLPLMILQHVAPRVLGRVSGYNYSRGKRLTLTLYTVDSAVHRMK